MAYIRFMKSDWKRDCAGRYVSRKTGLVIERSANGGWNVINPVTGGVLDNLPTKAEATRIYGVIKFTLTPT